MFDRLGALVSRHWALTVLLWVVVLVTLHLVAPRWDDVTRDGDFAYLPNDMTSVQGEELLERAFPEGRSKSRLVLVVSRPDEPLKMPGDWLIYEHLYAQCKALQSELAEQEHPARAEPEASTSTGGEAAGEAAGPIVQILRYDPSNPKNQLVGRKLIRMRGQRPEALLLILELREEFMAIANMDLMKDVNKMLDQVRSGESLPKGVTQFPEGLRLGVTGSAAIGSDMLLAAKESLDNTELTTIILVVVILFLVYRAPVLVIVPLTVIGVSVSMATDLVALLVQISNSIPWLDFKIFTTTRIFVVVILFGAGTDYCLFLISRYKEELQRGLSRQQATAEALGRVGDALAASALTTIFGLAMMVFADFGKFKNSGPVIALCLVVALMACVTLAPAMLRALGRVVFWPFGMPKPSGENGSQGPAPSPNNGRADPPEGSGLLTGLWQWLSRLIINHPGLILVGSILLLAVPAYEGMSIDVTYDLLNELQQSRPSVEGTRQLTRHFPPGETGPVTVLAEDPHEQFDSENGLRKISALTEDLYRLREVSLEIAWRAEQGDYLLREAVLVPANGNSSAATGRLIEDPKQITEIPLKISRLDEDVYLLEEPGGGGQLKAASYIFDETRLEIAPLADKPDLQKRFAERLGEGGGSQFVLIQSPLDGSSEFGHSPLLLSPGSDAVPRQYALVYRADNPFEGGPITTVRSLTEPLGDVPRPLSVLDFISAEGIARIHPQTRAFYVSQASGLEGTVTRLDLVFRYPPFSHESIRLLGHVERYLGALGRTPDSVWKRTRFYFTGTTAGIRDLEQVTTTDRLRIQVLVVLSVLIVILLILRRPMVCLYLILSVLLGYFVTMGITEAVFSWVYADTYDGLDWKVPLFLFVILIAVGQDYNIYLATRVFEEQRRFGPIEGLRVAVVRTGGIITSCGLIMAGTFASMITGTLRAMHELGFALSLGVLLDTFVIRTILVPAFLAIWDRPRGTSAPHGDHRPTDSPAASPELTTADR